MTPVGATTATAAIVPNGSVMTAGIPLGAASLLPPPSQGVGSIESLYALMEQASAQQQKNGKVEVEGKFEAKRAALEKFQAELKKAADEKSSGIFGTLATIGVVAAAVVGTVCTCGAAAPALLAVGLAISAGGFLVGETKCLDFMGEGVSKWVGLGLGVVGAVMTLGAGGGAGGASAVQVIQGGAAVASGCQVVDDAVHEYRANNHLTEGKAAEQQMRRIQEAIEDVITDLQDGKDASTRRGEAVNNIVEAEGKTLIIAAGGKS